MKVTLTNIYGTFGDSRERGTAVLEGGREARVVTPLVGEGLATRRGYRGYSPIRHVRTPWPSCA